MDSKIDELKKIIDKSNNIVFFGGAGVSTESGLKDFRSKDGLYNEKYDMPVEYYLSSKCFYKETDVFYDFYRKNLNTLNIKPNITHEYLTKLEKDGKLKAIVTQNIDGLHQKAGSKNVLEVHGSTYSNHCMECNKEYDAKYVFESEGIPRCKCGGVIKPDVVLYGEMLPDAYMDAIKYISKADVLIVAGTSLTVHPAASLINYYKGKYLIIINRDETPYDNKATMVFHDSLKNIIGSLID